MMEFGNLNIRDGIIKRIGSLVLVGGILAGVASLSGCAIRKDGMYNSTTSISDNIDDLKVETPILTPGHGSGDKVVYTGFTIGLEGYYAIKENMDKIDGWELYEKVGDTYKKIDGYEVETNIGETKIYVARAYVYNKENVKVYSEYSNEYKVDNYKGYRVNISLLDRDTKEYVVGANLVLKDIKGRVIAQFTTSNVPFYINGLKEGKYTLGQVGFPENYHLNEEVISFEVKDSDINVVMYNTKMTEEEIKEANNKKDEVFSNLVDVFDTDYKRNINSEYYVLRLRDAYKIYCEENPEGKTIDVESVPEYLFLKGTAFEAQRKYRDEIEYEFANWDDDISTTKDWKTDVSLVRIRKNSFALYLYFAKELGYDSFGFTIGVKDSYDYLKPLSSLSKYEVERLCEVYGYNEDVISLVNDYWFGPLMGLVPVRHTEDPVMSNGLTKSMNEAILRGAEIAGVKSKILRRRGIWFFINL